MTVDLYVQVGLAAAGLFATIVLAVVGFLITRSLNTIDKNQQELFERMHEAEKTLYLLKGEHDRNHQ